MLRIGRLLQLWTNIRSSLWFVPTIIVAGAILLALGMIELDLSVGSTLREDWPRLFAAEADGARAMLAAIAGTVVTVAGVVFSITIVALSQASTQYTPRILRRFMRDTTNQVVLGVFIGIFVYCLIVLRTLSSGPGQFVPALAVVTGVALTIVGMGFLILFIHHIATSIQASEIVASIAAETCRAIDRLFPEELGEEPNAGSPEGESAPEHWYAVPACDTGYIQSIVMTSLLRVAEQYDMVIRMERAIGDFVTVGRPIVSVSRAVNNDITGEVNAVYAIDSYRTIDQDAAFGIRQLVDIALKALSPGVNDTSTAVICVDYLSAILEHLVRRRIESPYRVEDGVLRVVAIGPTFEDLLTQSYNQILENGEGNMAVLRRILIGIGYVCAATRNPARLRALSDQIDMTGEVIERSIKTTAARRDVEEQLQKARIALREATGYGQQEQSGW